tara:strand:+ start:1756 stop:2610 length:855 start_codon:yes stop_codon:yes gene_type:complete
MPDKKIQFDDLGATSRVNFDANQYSDNFFGFRVVGAGDTAINLTGYGFTGSIKKHSGAGLTATDTISLGFNTEGRSSGIVTAIVTAGVSTNFNKNSPRYTYEIDVTNESTTKKTRIVSGDINVNVGVTESDIGESLKCIAVIDESDGGTTVSVTEWQEWRLSFPEREHYILQPTSTGIAITSDLMSNAVQAVYDSGFDDGRLVQGVNRDEGNSENRSDWFGIVGLQTGVDTRIGLFVDVSGSMTLSTVQASYNKFLSDCSSAGIQINPQTNAAEDWLEPFTGIL